jgi:hypothetical protein
VLCVVCRDVNIWISVILLQEGPPVESLLIWYRRVVEKIKECVEEFIVACFFFFFLVILKMDSLGLLWVPMSLIPIV